MANAIIVGRNPSPKIGRNPSPRMQPTFRVVRVNEASTTDTNGILVSVVDNHNGTFIITVDDSTAVTDPADGYTLIWRLRDVVGADVGPFVRAIATGFQVINTPPGGSDLVVMHGITTGSIAGTLLGYGLNYAPGQLNLRTFIAGTTIDTPVDADTSGVGSTFTFRPDSPGQIPETQTIAGWAFALDADGLFNAQVVPSVTSALQAIDDIYIWVSVFRTATGGGDATVEFTFGYQPPFVTDTFLP